MLKLQNVCKTYKTKAKTETQALKNVNLELSSRGMVFVLGKSGSGKSTLLNLLGGLDSPTRGEIFVDGKSMASFTPSDYADYRNDYVGFIFQEFNLLADFNVKDNVSLALKLRKTENTDGKVSEALKQVELTDDYLTRRIDEMSGGEKQRIAIARALIKQSKMILADEPTGNLDSQTGESIWNILKSLSTERLVVVVSHDRESAEKYADRIIEIADGEIISDTGTQPSEVAGTQPIEGTEVADTQPSEAEQPASAANEVPQPPKKKRKNRLSFATCLKMGFNNLRLRKAKTISVILIAIFSIFSIVITQMALTFSPEASLAKYIKQNGVEYFTVTQGRYDTDNKFSLDGKMMTENTKQYIEKNSQCIADGIIESKQDILDMGLTFVGEALEPDGNSFYISSDRLEACYGLGDEVEVDGSYVRIDRELHPIEFLIGKKVGLYSDPIAKGSVLAGVVETNREYEDMLPLYFYTKEFVGLKKSFSLRMNTNDEHKDATMYFGEGRYDGEMYITDSSAERPLNPYNAVIVTADGLWTNGSQIVLADNEIVLPFEIFKVLFNAESKWDYVDGGFNLRSVPKEIGQTFKMKLCKYGTGELVGEYEVKLAGVCIERAPRELIFNIIAGREIAQLLAQDCQQTTFLIRTNSVKNLGWFAKTLRRNYDCGIACAGLVEMSEIQYGSSNGDIAQIAYNFEIFMKTVSIIFLVLGAILVVILVLLVVNLVSFSITNRRKEIGILSAIGASNKDIMGIFLLETSIIAAFIFIFGLVVSFVFAFAANVYFSADNLLEFNFPFLRVDIVTIVTLVAASFGLLLLATLIPIRNIIKLKPVDAIREA